MRVFTVSTSAIIAVSAMLSLSACSAPIGSPSGGAAGSRNSASQEWDKLCVIDALNIPENSIHLLADDVIWAGSGVTLRREQGHVKAQIGGKLYDIFSGDVDDEIDGTKQDVFTGEFSVNDRWILFLSADSLKVNQPWRLHVWDRQNPDRPAKVIGSYKGGAENPGFTLQQLRGGKAVWVEPTATDQRKVQYADLTSGSVRTLAEGSVYAAIFIDDTTVAWQSQQGDQVTVEAFDLTAGKRFVPQNPIATMDSRGGSFASDGEYWVLANVPSGDIDNEDTTYDTWAWKEGWKEKRKVVSLIAPAYISPGQPLSNGYLGVNLQRQGAFLINLNNGVAQQMREDGGIIEPGTDGIRIFLSQTVGEEEKSAQALLPLDSIAQSGKCAGELEG